MLTTRQIDHSILDHLEALFTTPPGGFTNAFNVYFEDTFFNPSFAPTAPYVWLLNKDAMPTKTRTPLVIIKRGAFGWAPFELGNREGQICTYSLICFGRNDGEVTDLVAFLKKHLDPIPIYDYDTDPKTLLTKAHLDHLVEIPIDVGGEVGLEGALKYQEALSFDFVNKEL